MPVAEEQDQAQSASNGGHSTALKAAAAAAATGAATLAVRKAMSHGESRDDEEGGTKSRGSGNTSALLRSAGSSAWEAASNALLPMAEDAAEAAGKYLAEKAPDVVRERIVPRFIEAFNNSD
jgi:hypothetical protein